MTQTEKKSVLCFVTINIFLRYNFYVTHCINHVLVHCINHVLVYHFIVAGA